MKPAFDPALMVALASYQAAFGLALMGAGAVAPFLVGRSRRIREGLREYFGGLPRPPAGPLVWVHGVSMGESAVAGALMDGLRKRAPGLRLGFTTTHPDVLATERRRKRADVMGYFPLDTWPGMERAFDRWKPVMVIVSETDFWPIFSQACRSRKIPLVLANGRISDKLLNFYASFPAFGRAVFEPFSVLAVQSESDARKLRDMGAHAERIVITGNVKADLAPPAGTSATRRMAEWAGASRLLVFGSLHPAEFDAFMPIFTRIHREERDCRLLVAPRNLANVPAWEDRLRAAGVQVIRRTGLDGAAPAPGDARVMLLDTMGELATLYGLAAGAFVGGSLDPSVGGHNPLEVLNQGVPLVMGPHVRNFADLVDELVSNGAMRQAETAERAYAILSEISGCGAQRTALRAAADEVLARHRGALERTLDLVFPLLPRR